MKKSVLLLALVAATLLGCQGDEAGSVALPDGAEPFGIEGSYALGMIMGLDFRSGGIFPDIDEFARGLRDALAGETRITIDEAVNVLESAYLGMLRDREARFLAENALRSGINVTASGLQFEVLVEGDGARPGPTDIVRVHYEGALVTGAVFDSSFARGFPEQFSLDMVIPGWAEGIQLMTEGSVYRFFIPSALGYGPGGVEQFIPPYATLVFEVQLIGIVESDG